ncbi:hypothetical protein BDZ89DRAFT_1121517 [Hymenopellis radicata]|nr:hypothetical protein BDZ89DRAFT_1121517 [Hymenopellis radicata]
MCVPTYVGTVSIQMDARHVNIPKFKARALFCEEEKDGDSPGDNSTALLRSSFLGSFLALNRNQLQAKVDALSRKQEVKATSTERTNPKEVIIGRRRTRKTRRSKPKPGRVRRSCSQCRQWLSPRMAYQLENQALSAIDIMRVAEKKWEHGQHLTLSPTLLPYSDFIPPGVYTRSLQRAFYRGYIAVFRAFCDLLHGPGVINADVLKALVRNTYRNSETSYFFAKGGRVEHVLAAITVEAEKNFLQDMKFLELPQCNRDRKFELAKAKLGLDADTFWGPYGCATSPESSDNDREDEGDEMKDFDMEASDRGLRELNEFLARLPSLDEVK